MARELPEHWWMVGDLIGTTFAVCEGAYRQIEKAIDHREHKVTFVDRFGAECVIYRPHQTVVSAWESGREHRRVSRVHEQEMEQEKKEDVPSFD